MSSTPPSDETTAAPAPVLFQQPRPGPGRPPSLTSTSEPLQSSTTPESNPSGPAESLTNPAPDWSTSSHPGSDESAPNDTSGDSLGSEVNAEALTGLRGSIAAGVMHVTEAAHSLATDDVGRHLGQFLASDTEVMEISTAGARILSRKLPKGVGNPDLEDALRLAGAVASYVGRQIKIMRQARAARRQIRAAAAASEPGDQPA